MKGQRDLTERYTRNASAYRDLWAPVLRPVGRRLIDKLSHVSARRVLDVGTGVGSLLADLGQAFPQATVLGVDRSIGMLSHAPAGSSVAVMDAAQLGLPSDSMDVVIVPFALFHFPVPVDALTEVHRVLRPRGTIGTVTWGSELFESKADRAWAMELDARGATPLGELPHLACHDLMDSPDKVEGLLRSAGFREAEAWQQPYEFSFNREHFVDLKTRLGRQKLRLDSLDDETRAECVEAAVARVSRLLPEDFVSRGTVVFATGRAI